MSGRRPIGLRDVAAAASVSVATVSRYLNGSLRLPRDTAARIDRATRELGYRPNPHARRLSTGRSDTVGLVVPDIANPFFARLAGAVEAEAHARGLDLMLCATRNDLPRELDYIALMRRSHVDGLLFATNHRDDGALARAIADAADGAGQIVLLDEDVPGALVPKVFADNVQGGYLAAQHLAAAGHRRLALIGGPPGMLSTTERLRGFRRAAREAGPGIELATRLCDGYTPEQGARATEALLASASPPTALFATSDELTIGVLEAIHARGLSVPADVSLVSFDDVRPLHLFGPPVTAIRQDVAEMGRRAFAMLAPDSQTRVGGTVRLPVSLIERHSVCAPRPAQARTRRIRAA